MIMIYYTLCYSEMIYCISMCGCTLPTFLDKVIKVEEAVLRVIIYNWMSETTESINKYLKHEYLSYSEYFGFLIVIMIEGTYQKLKIIINILGGFA